MQQNLRNPADAIWRSYEQSVTEALAQRSYTKASSLVKEALSKACAYKSVDHSLLNQADQLADFHLKQGDFQTAASILRLTVELKKDAFGDGHPDVERSMQAFLQALGDAGNLSPNHIYTPGRTLTA
jgi:hypothetical protein